ncbi:MAG: aldo/keto reductase, partial [Alphaproteobacteria bacterium]
MRYRQVGRTGIFVSEIALGTWLTCENIADRTALNCRFRSALDLGINFFDTAGCYGNGLAEQILGESLKGIGRDRFIINTKIYFPYQSELGGLSREAIFRQIDSSLKRLRVDYVDILMCHRYDPAVQLDETF